MKKHTFHYYRIALCGILLLMLPLKFAAQEESAETCPAAKSAHDLHIQTVSGCCQFASKVKDLYPCITDYLSLREREYNQQQHTRSPSQLNIVFATYISTSIQQYAAYYLLNNVIYANTQQYPMKVLMEDQYNYAPDDQRWNKIPAIRDGLTTWAKDADYIVFLDADIMILNHQFNLTSLILRYPQAHIILSEDSLDFANSGFLIVKNSVWSQQFLRRWWLMKDHTPNTFCDQHVLNKLSLQLEDENNLYPFLQLVNQKVLNSIWPPIETFDEKSDFVLHMLGEYATTREAVGKAYIEKLCPIVYGVKDDTSKGSTSGKKKVKSIRKSLLRKDELEQIKVNSIKIKFYEELHKVNDYPITINYSPSKELSVDEHKMNQAIVDGCEELVGIVQHLCESSKRTQQNFPLCFSMVTKTNQFLDRRAKQFQEQIAENKRINDGITWSHDEASFLVSLGDIQASLLYHNMTWTTDLPNVISLSESLLRKFDQLVLYSDYIDRELPENRIYVHKFRGKVFVSVGSKLLEARMYKFSIKYLMVAISEISSALEQFGPSPEGEALSNFQEIVMMYIEAAQALAKSYFNNNDLSSSKEWIHIALTNIVQLKSDYRGEERLIITLFKSIITEEQLINARESDEIINFNTDNMKYYATRSLPSPTRTT